MRHVGLGVLLCVLASCLAFRRRLEMGVCRSNASWRLVFFYKGILKWERAVRMRLVCLGVLFLGSCRVFQMRLEMGACHANASCRSCLVLRTRLELGACHANGSCRSWHLVMRLGVLSCFSNASRNESVLFECLL